MMTTPPSETVKIIKELLNSRKSVALTEKEDAYRLNELRKVFTKLIIEGELKESKRNLSVSKEGLLEKEVLEHKWKQWLYKKYIEFLDELLDRLNKGKKYAVRITFGIIAISDGEKKWMCYLASRRLMFMTVKSLCVRETYIEEGLLRMLDVEFISPYRDVQYLLLVAVRQLSKDILEDKVSSNEVVSHNILRLLLLVEIPGSDLELKESNFLLPLVSHVDSDANKQNERSDYSDDKHDDLDCSSSDSDDQSSTSSPKKKRYKPTKTKKEKISKSAKTASAVQRLSQHRNALSHAWFSYLRIPDISSSNHKLILKTLPKSIIPKMVDPILLADYFIQSYDIGGYTATLALHGLFVLMTEHNLEYDCFYDSLYALLDSSIFYSNHGTKFLQLLSTCLSRSTMLPSYLVASFCKRLVRVSLTSPPSGILFVLALISNLLRKYSSITGLIYRTAQNDTASSTQTLQMQDPFDSVTNKTSETKALQSSLWELNALEKHYHHTVSTMAKSIGYEGKKTPLYDIDNFLLYSYELLVEQEMNERKIKKKATKIPLTFRRPTDLFSHHDNALFGNSDDGILNF